MVDKITHPLERDLLFLMKDSFPWTREEISVVLGYPRTTIYDHLRKLEKKGLVCKQSVVTGKRGRPFVYWMLDFRAELEVEK